MSNSISRLTFYERQQIEYYRRHKRKIREIARFLKRDHSIISRELRRNGSRYLPYSAVAAQEIADRRATKTNKRKLDKNERLREYVLSRLKKDWSPDQIAGRLKQYPPPELRGCTI